LLDAENWTDPSPCPDRVEVIVSHVASLDAVHVHSRAVETESDPLPPPAATVEPPVRAMAHRVVDGLVTVLVDEPHPEMAASTAMAKRLDPFTVDRDARARPKCPAR
jgi:hypothetical protein